MPQNGWDRSGEDHKGQEAVYGRGLTLGFLYSYGGRETALQARAQEGLKTAEAEGRGVLAQAEEKGKELLSVTERKANEVKEKVLK